MSDKLSDLASAATQNGFEVVEHSSRQIPESKRYMPLPNSSENSLSKRIKTEYTVTFIKKA